MTVRLKEFYRLRRRLFCIDEGENGGIETVFRFPVGEMVSSLSASSHERLGRCPRRTLSTRTLAFVMGLIIASLFAFLHLFLFVFDRGTGCDSGFASHLDWLFL